MGGFWRYLPDGFFFLQNLRNVLHFGFKLQQILSAVIMDRLCEKCRKEFEEKIHLNRLLESAVERNHLLCVDLYKTAGAHVNITAGADVNIITGADAISYHRPVKICCQNGYDKCLKQELM